MTDPSSDIKEIIIHKCYLEHCDRPTFDNWEEELETQGSFVQQIMLAMMKADSINLNKLKLVYPNTVALYEKWKANPWKPPETWICHICGDRRHDHMISVSSHPIIMDGQLIGQENIRFCNDKLKCSQEAEKKSFIKNTKKENEQ